ncbi:hypothetical protein BGX28_006400 [Mortierella sp. GBA30]|nr:hypothetical protein BGX28_006400 [Mortierella sp. GBA30]
MARQSPWSRLPRETPGWLSCSLSLSRTEEEEPVYKMDMSKCLPGKWAEGAIVRGVRTHFYLQNEFFKEKSQPEILPALLEHGIIKPNNQRIVEGAMLVERAQNALSLLRSKAVSGEMLVYRVSEA